MEAGTGEAGHGKMEGEGGPSSKPPTAEPDSPAHPDYHLRQDPPRRPSGGAGMRRPSPHMIHTVAIDIVDPLAGEVPTPMTAVSSYGPNSAVGSGHTAGGHRSGHLGSTPQRYLDNTYGHPDDMISCTRVLDPFEEEGGEGVVQVPSLDDKLLAGEEIIVPDDCSIYEALTRVLPGGSVLVKEGVHEWDGQVTIRATNVLLRGERFRRREGGALRCPKLAGRWNLAYAGSGVIESLDLTNSEGADGVLLVSGGNWTLRDCVVRCCSAFPVQARSNAAYKGFDIALHCSGGGATLVRCRVGGVDGEKRAYHACHVTKGGALRLEDCVVCYCYGAAFGMRDSARIEMFGCEIKRNGHTFAAGYPNEAFLRLDRCKIYKNGSLWKGSRPKEVKDEQTNTDLLGYTVNLFTTA